MLSTTPSGSRRTGFLRGAANAAFVAVLTSLLLGVGQFTPRYAVADSPDDSAVVAARQEPAADAPSSEPDPTGQATQEASAPQEPTANPDPSTEASPDATLPAGPSEEATPDAAPDSTPEGAPEATPDASADATPDATPGAEPSVEFEEITPTEPSSQPTRGTRSVPVAPAGHVVISVRIGGDRAADTGTQIERMNNAQATGVAGVTLYLGGPGYKYAAPDGTVTAATFTPYGSGGIPYSWATCVSDAQGDCNFIVPIVTGVPGHDSTGMLYNRRPWVGMSTTAQPAITTPGWHMPATSVFNNNVDTGIDPTIGNASAFTYLFRMTNVTAGLTYRSTDQNLAFLKNGEGDSTNFIPGNAGVTQPGTPVSGGRYMVVRDNPGLKYTPDCTLKMGIVLDLSSSMSATEVNQAKTAINGMVNALTGKSTQLGIFSFNRISPAMQGTGSYATNYPGPYPVSNSTQATTFKNLYSTWTAPAPATAGAHAATNWDHALTTVANSGVTYDVVVFITDGSPTTLSANPDGAWALSSAGYIANTRALEAGVFSANSVKSKGTRVVPFYIHDDPLVTGGALFALLNNVRNISGPTPGSDFYYNSNFTDLATYLNGFAQSCANTSYSANVNVNKRIQDADGTNERAASGWTLGASATATAGTVTQSPVAPTQVTPASGRVSWALKLGNASSRAKVAISETQQAGYEFVSGTCTITTNAGEVTTVAIPNANGVTLTGVQPKDNVNCTFINKPPAAPSPATVKVNKVVQDVDGLNPQPGVGWTLGAATTLSSQGGGVSQTPSATTQVTPASGQASWDLAFTTGSSRASVAVSETQQPGYQFVSGTCTVTNGNGSVTTVSIPNEAGVTPTDVQQKDAVVCTFINKPVKPAIINVTKRIQDADGTNERVAPDWTLGATTTATTGTVTTNPAAPTQVTPANGKVTWTATFGTAASRASVAVSETMKPDWQFVSGTCVVTPVTGSPRTVTLTGATGNPAVTDVAPGETVDCTFVNKPVTGSVSWQKVNGGQHLAGSAWKITGPSPATTELAVVDCVSAPCAGPDTDQRPGYLKVGSLAAGGYTLVETKAPAGYILDTTPHSFTIGTTTPAKLDWDLGAIENKQQLVPNIPLTGGIGRDHLIIAGSALLLAALLSAFVFRRRAVNASRFGGRFAQD